MFKPPSCYFQFCISCGLYCFEVSVVFDSSFYQKLSEVCKNYMPLFDVFVCVCVCVCVFAQMHAQCVHMCVRVCEECFLLHYRFFDNSICCHTPLSFSLSLSFSLNFCHISALQDASSSAFLDFRVFDRSCNPTIEVVTFCLHGWCMLGVFLFAGIHPLGQECQDLLSLLQWNACMHRLDLGLYSHPKEFFWEWSQNLCKLQGKYPLYWRLRGGLNLHRCITQDSEPCTLLTELFRPHYRKLLTKLMKKFCAIFKEKIWYQ